MHGVPRPKVIPAGSGRSVTLFGVRFGYKVEGGDSDGSIAVLETEIAPRALVKPHMHTREDETSLVVAGTVGARIGDEVLEAARRGGTCSSRAASRTPSGTAAKRPQPWSRSSSRRD